MTTQVTTVQQSKQGVRALIGATALAVMVLGGTAIWQLRPSSEATTPDARTVTAVTTEAGAPVGGMAELYHAAQQAQAVREAAQVTTHGGMAELYAEQQAENRASIERESRLGGMAEL